MSSIKPGSGRENRLASSSSPYLLLHRHNPVDWYPWGDEALERARREDLPIFLSVGYSTCYWCHVMERESFSDPHLAEFMNRNFVNIKLDREERPELDEIYMTATQLQNGQGGWPNSVFLFPDLRPFFAGTYFPPEDRHGRPGFGTVLGAVAEAWKSKRGELEEHAAELALAVGHFLEERGQPATPPGTPPDAALISSAADRSFAALRRRFDSTSGGFGSAPKFPTPGNLYFLHQRATDFGLDAAARREAGEMLSFTLDAMARGGICDQLAGGFHRYATDREWRVPHFEKMLYDNGLLLELFALEYERTGAPDAARTARQIVEWLENEMSSSEGGYWSAIDAETHGHEGAYYVWTRIELEAILGAEDADFLAPILGFEGAPFFEDDAYVLHRPLAWEGLAARRQVTVEELLAEVAPLRQRLLASRSGRDRPLTDDKILAEWNGMVIRGLAVAGRVLSEPTMVRRAERAAEFVLASLRPQGNDLRRSFRGQASEIPAFLADYVYLIRGLLALHRATSPTGATGDARWLDAAVSLHAEQGERLGDGRGGYFTAAASPDVLFRGKEIFDGAVPATQAIALWNALELGAATGEPRFEREADGLARSFAEVIAHQPEGPRMLIAALPSLTTGSGRSDHSDRSGLSVVRVAMESVRLVAGAQSFTLRIRLAEGWHVTLPDGIEVEAEGIDLADLVLPSDGDIEGEFEIHGSLHGGPGVLHARVQPCEVGRCLQTVAFRFDVPAVPPLD